MSDPFNSLQPHAVTSANGTSYTYDACGNMITRGVQQLSYNAQNQLKAIDLDNNGTDDIEFGYNAAGQRLWKKKNGILTGIWIGGVYEYKDQDADGEGVALCHVYSEVGLIATFEPNPTQDSVFYYYHSDHLGSSSVITDRNGGIQKHYGYSAFGDERYDDAAYSGNMDTSNRYTGQVLDEDTGLYYYNARYYDPLIARFIQPDTVLPTLSSQGLNRYTYTFNNPLKFTDPSGNIPTLEQYANDWLSASNSWDSWSSDYSSWSSGYSSSAGSYNSASALSSNLMGGSHQLQEFTWSNFRETIPLSMIGEAFGLVAKQEGADALRTVTNSGIDLLNLGAWAIEKPYQWLGGDKLGRLDRVGWWKNNFVEKSDFHNKLDEFFYPLVTGYLAGEAIGAMRGAGAATSLDDIACIDDAVQYTDDAARFRSSPKGILAAPKMHKHHIFPQAERFGKYWRQAGISIDDFTVQINETTHLRGVHGRGLGDLPGRWNQTWDNFFKINPNPSAKDIFQQAGQMMDDFGLSNLKIESY